MDLRRLHVLASIGTRLALGGFPLALVVLIGWLYGKRALDVAAAASNWANYLNIFLLSGFVLVPPAVARLQATRPNEEDRAAVRDHVALMRCLMVVCGLTAMTMWAGIGRAFPELATHSGSELWTWYPMLAVLSLSQLPLTLWLGVAQAAGHYCAAFMCTALPRAATLTLVVAAYWVGFGPTAAIAAAVCIVLAGQALLARSARRALANIDRDALQIRGSARVVLSQNLSAGAVGLVGALVSIAPVTIVGRLLPSDIGYAHVMVTLSNAVGAVMVAAFFPGSLTLAQRAGEPDALRRHSLRVARDVGLVTGALILSAWLLFPACARISDACTIELYGVGSLVLLGAGLRLASLGAYHAAVIQHRPHISLISASIEAVAVVTLTWWLTEGWRLYALGAAFVVGGGLRLAVALSLEMRFLAGRTKGMRI